MRAPRLTMGEAADLARTTAAQVRAALYSGDLRDLTRSSVEAWVRARVADTVTKANGSVA